ncbi:MAG TPA: DUF2262 domain-containing protein [Bacillota bacterium]|nr:DUF2262 domain-containing protein [Bacillota bacterium]
MIQDDFFGAIQYDREYSCYCCELDCGGEKITLSFIVDLEETQINRVIDDAKKLCKNLYSWLEKAREYAADELLDLKNESWLKEDEEEMQPEEFKGRMRLETISFYEDGDFDFWCNDGGLFWGNSIQVSGNLKRGFNCADIPG